MYPRFDDCRSYSDLEMGLNLGVTFEKIKMTKSLDCEIQVSVTKSHCSA